MMHQPPCRAPHTNQPRRAALAQDECAPQGAPQKARRPARARMPAPDTPVVHAKVYDQLDANDQLELEPEDLPEIPDIDYTAELAAIHDIDVASDFESVAVLPETGHFEYNSILKLPIFRHPRVDPPRGSIWLLICHPPRRLRGISATKS